MNRLSDSETDATISPSPELSVAIATLNLQPGPWNNSEEPKTQPIHPSQVTESWTDLTQQASRRDQSRAPTRSPTSNLQQVQAIATDYKSVILHDWTERRDFSARDPPRGVAQGVRERGESSIFFKCIELYSSSLLTSSYISLFANWVR